MTKLSRIHSLDVFQAQPVPRAHNASAAMNRAHVNQRIAWAAGALALVSLAGVGAKAQQSSTTTLKTGITYTDQSSDTCEQQNANNPYAGMNPLVCYGEMAPTDSQGQCTLGGWQVLKKEGNTCYYCAPITSPPSIIIPMDQVGVAESQGWGCGLDQADACMAICKGGKTLTPLPGTVVAGGGPGLPPTPAPVQGGPPANYAPMPGPAGGIGYVGGANPCLPQGPGGYDYCQNGPGARLPAGCSCPGTKPQSTTSSEYGPCQPAQADEPAAAPYLRYTLGFEKGFGGCAVTQAVAGNVAAGAFGSAYSVVPSMLNISATPQTIQSVMHPAGPATNSDPYLEGQVDGNRLCAWLLKNAAGTIGACPGSQQPGSQPATQQPAADPPVPDFANKLLADAQTLLQNAGRISKAMTDSMNPATHNNVGIGIAVGAYFGALGKLMGVVAQEYQVLAAAAKVAQQEGSVLQIAGEAAAESGATATEAEQALQGAAQAGSAAGEPVMGAATGSSYVNSAAPGYLQGATMIGESGVVQGKLPTCAVLSCDHLAEMLGKNIGTMRSLDNFRPTVKLVISATGETTATGGLTAPQVAASLKAVGIDAAVGDGLTNMLNQVRAGTPVIAGMYESGAGISMGGALHAVVVESISTVNKVPTLTVWDPRGWVYTQSAEQFGAYFSQIFVHPL